MRSLTKKLKLDHYDDIYILNVPEAFAQVFDHVKHSESLVITSCTECVVVFVNTKEEFVEQMYTLFPRLLDDSVLWVFYPNETTISEISKLHIEFDWDFLGDYRLKPTKLIAVDDHWNAIKIKKIIS